MEKNQSAESAFLALKAFNELTDEELRLLFGDAGALEKCPYADVFRRQRYQVAKHGAITWATAMNWTAQPTNHPDAEAILTATYRVTGGGVYAPFVGPGTMLTASRPIERAPYYGWYGAAKDHIEPNPNIVYVYAIGIRND